MDEVQRAGAAAAAPASRGASRPRRGSLKAQADRDGDVARMDGVERQCVVADFDKASHVENGEVRAESEVPADPVRRVAETELTPGVKVGDAVASQACDDVQGDWRGGGPQAVRAVDGQGENLLVPSHWSR